MSNAYGKHGNYMRCYVRKRTLGHLLPTKIQVSLRNREIWSESLLGIFWIVGCNVSSYGQRRLWLDAQADLSLLWAHWSGGTFSHVTAHINNSFNSFGAKCQTAFVVYFFLNKLSLEKKFICSGERLNVKQRRSRRDVASGPMLFAKAYYYRLWQ